MLITLVSDGDRIVGLISRRAFVETIGKGLQFGG